MIDNELHTKQIHRHPKQLIAFLVGAYITVVAFARGTGKTHGVTATWLYLRAKLMPRSTGFVLSITYAHLIDTIIPAMQKSWAEMGLVEGVHYWVRQKPPKELGIPEPITPVDDPKYFIFWVNGSVTKLVSMDRQAMVNSKSFDYGAFCECRKLPGDRVEDDVIPTVRGNDDRFGHLPEHGSLLFESDLPKDIKGKWWLKYKNQMDEETVNWIMQCRQYIYELEQKPQTKTIQKHIEEVKSQIDIMRKDLVHWIEAQSFDNIHALGEKNMRYLKRTLTEKDYDISVLNIMHEEVEDCFYSHLDKDIQGYDAFNYKFIDKQEKLKDQDCRWDLDVNLNKPIDVTMDWNLRHSCLDAFQFRNNTRFLLKHFYITAPQTELDCVDNFCKYYEFHQTKEINLIYNSTFTNGEQVGGRVSKRQEIQSRFEENGWKVTPIPLGQAWTHQQLYYEWAELCQGKKKWKFLYNKSNTQIWYDACKDTAGKNITKKRGDKLTTKFEKDKSSERQNSGILPQHATHPTESVDQILQYDCTRLNSTNQNFAFAYFG